MHTFDLNFDDVKENRGHCFVGVDPGKSGGIAFLYSDGSLRIARMPVFDGKGYASLDIAGLFAVMSTAKHVRLAVVESQQAYPKQGLSSTFTTGYSFGVINACLTGLRIPIAAVRPQKWKKHFDLSVKRDKSMSDNNHQKIVKQLSVDRAQQIFPDFDFRKSKRAKKADHNLCEAALLAKYAQHLYYAD